MMTDAMMPAMSTRTPTCPAARLRAGILIAALAGAVAAAIPSPVAAQTPAPEDWRQQPIAVMQGLDKVTARISRFSVPVGATYRFGTLNIRVETCQDLPPTLPPESAAFVHVEDQPPDETARDLFSGWMFASSPGLNALEHPVYDVWVASCSSASTEGQSSSDTSN